MTFKAAIVLFQFLTLEETKSTEAFPENFGQTCFHVCKVETIYSYRMPEALMLTFKNFYKAFSCNIHIVIRKFYSYHPSLSTDFQLTSKVRNQLFLDYKVTIPNTLSDKNTHFAEILTVLFTK